MSGAAQHAAAVPRSQPQHLFRTNCAQDSTLTVGELNTQLDRLAAVQSRDKAGVLRSLCMRSTPRMMYWIVCIILKDLKVCIAYLL